MPAPSLARRAFLRGHTRIEAPRRPPWALDEPDFLTACTTCGDCVTACPEVVLRRADGGYPIFDPELGECTFCAACVSACEPRALDRGRGLPWLLKAQIGPNCLALNGVACFSCRDACGERAIGFRAALGGSVPQLDADRCTGCGACVGICPVSAIDLADPARAEIGHG